ncbi:MAG TPA: NAD-dependent protein deacylase [Phycisphaerae bacterium]|nr:NAD-dependent protein deacylase [Phycisphaerae bacterium]HNU46678.1 NAD-dependent protein deacylase [Phycisphaerae bacterium]
MNAIEQLAGWLSGAKAGVAFSGAGMSTESGIADFRSPGGIWSRFPMVDYDDFLRSREARKEYWRMRLELYKEFGGARPNPGHLALAKLEELGHVKAVITQNIDGLHQDAGSTRVIELHGTARKMACLRCGKEWPPEWVLDLVRGGDEAPECDQCGGPIKARTILFGQPMPIREMEEAAELAQESDVFLALGSSLTVEPAASMPRLAKHAGALLVIINRTETALDDLADLIIRDSIGTTLTEVLRRVEAAGS